MATNVERLRWVRRHVRPWLEAGYADYALTPLCRLGRRGRDLAPTVNLLGTQRGGSTWVQELLSSGSGVCPLFEPLAGRWFRQRYRLDVPMLAAGDDAPELARFLGEVMAGRRLRPGLSRLCRPSDVIRADQFVVKHVRMNLAAGWLVEQFPSSPVVILVRHPCAVVESLQRVDWGPRNVGRALAELPPGGRALVEELLDGRRAVAAAVAAVWAVQVRALLEDTTPESAQLVTFEAVSDDPIGVLGPVMEEVGLPRPTDLGERAGRPSNTANARSVVRSGGDPVMAWTQRLAPEVRDEVLAVVAAAGVTGYGPDPRPDEAALRDHHARAIRPKAQAARPEPLEG